MSWVPRARTWKRRRVKACRVCQFPYHPSRALGRNRTGCLPVTSWPLCQVSYKGTGVPGAIRTRGLLLTEETLYPLELRRRELGKRDSDAHLKASRACGMPVTPFPIGAACRSRTRCLGGTSSALSPDELTRHGYARRESDPHQLGSRPSPSTCLRHERLEPLDGLEPHAFPVRKGRSGQVSYRGMSWGTRARTWTLLLQGQACCLVTPFPIKIREDRAPPGIRTPDLPIKSRTL